MIKNIFQWKAEKGKLEPGYIKAYLPGVRENGGQYTHEYCCCGHFLERLTNNCVFAVLNIVRKSCDVQKVRLGFFSLVCLAKSTILCEQEVTTNNNTPIKY